MDDYYLTLANEALSSVGRLQPISVSWRRSRPLLLRRTGRPRAAPVRAGRSTVDELVGSAGVANLTAAAVAHFTALEGWPSPFTMPR
jgi:hypothetical protein